MPIQSLPSEILQYIFRQGVSITDDFDRSRRRYLSKLSWDRGYSLFPIAEKAASVCTRWRSIAISDPSLRILILDIDLDYRHPERWPHKLAQAKARVARSTCGIFLTVYDTRKPPLELLNGFNCRLRNYVPSVEDEPPDRASPRVLAWLKLIDELAPRLRALNLPLHRFHDHLEVLNHFEAERTTDFLPLETLAVACEADTRWIPMQDFPVAIKLDQVAPNLATLRLVQPFRFFDWTQCTLPGMLSELILEETCYGDWGFESWVAFRDQLLDLRGLTKLRVKYYHGEALRTDSFPPLIASRPPINLRNLHIDCLVTWRIFILHDFTFPELRNLNLDFTSFRRDFFQDHFEPAQISLPLLGSLTLQVPQHLADIFGDLVDSLSLSDLHSLRQLNLRVQPKLMRKGRPIVPITISSGQCFQNLVSLTGMYDPFAVDVTPLALQLPSLRQLTLIHKRHYRGPYDLAPCTVPSTLKQLSNLNGLPKGTLFFAPALVDLGVRCECDAFVDHMPVVAAIHGFLRRRRKLGLRLRIFRYDRLLDDKQLWQHIGEPVLILKEAHSDTYLL